MTTTSKLAAPSQCQLHQRGHELQAFGTVRPFPVAVPAATRLYSCRRHNRLLADAQVLYALDISRLLEAHEIILAKAHDAAGRVDQEGEDTNDLIVAEVIRTGEMQAWFLAEHLVDTPLVRSDNGR